MTHKKLFMSLLAAGLVVAATSVAFTLVPLIGVDSFGLSGAPAPKTSPLEQQPGQLGLTLRPLTHREKARTALEGGLLIQGVSGAAARAGLVPGEVVLAINGVAVNSVDQVIGIMKAKPQRVELQILHHGERVFVPVSPG
ncbi:MAG: PDZ domain-containing protein [Polaromonas sp.]|nr:PDZ domain-containing protein [Polaromonas sp.]